MWLDTQKQYYSAADEAAEEAGTCFNYEWLDECRLADVLSWLYNELCSE